MSSRCSCAYCKRLNDELYQLAFRTATYTWVCSEWSFSFGDTLCLSYWLVPFPARQNVKSLFESYHWLALLLLIPMVWFPPSQGNTCYEDVRYLSYRNIYWCIHNMTLQRPRPDAILPTTGWYKVPRYRSIIETSSYVQQSKGFVCY